MGDNFADCFETRFTKMAREISLLTREVTVFIYDRLIPCELIFLHVRKQCHT